MPVGSGLSGQLGIASEGTYGTFATPTRFLASEDASLQKTKNVVQGGGLNAGTLVDRGQHRVITSRAGSGSFRCEVHPKQFGLLFQHIFGGPAPVYVAGAGAALGTNTATFTLADNLGDSLSIQAGVPNLYGTVYPYSYLGCKVTDAEFSQAIDALLMLNTTIDARDVSESQALAVASYPASGDVPFQWAGFGIKVGTYGAEAAVQGVRGVSVKVTRAQRVDRQYGNNAGLKAEPIMNAKAAITGSLDVDFMTKADFADRFASDAGFSLILSWTGNIIGTSTTPESLTLTLPECHLDGATPMVTGYDVVTGAYPFTALFDGTHAPITATYVTADTAV